MELEDYVEEIKTRKDFCQFLNLLLEDYMKQGENWENNTLEDFLGALQAFSLDISGYYKNTDQTIDPDTPSWRVFADMILGSTIYE